MASLTDPTPSTGDVKEDESITEPSMGAVEDNESNTDSLAACLAFVTSQMTVGDFDPNVTLEEVQSFNTPVDPTAISVNSSTTHSSAGEAKENTDVPTQASADNPNGSDAEQYGRKINWLIVVHAGIKGHPQYSREWLEYLLEYRKVVCWCLTHGFRIGRKVLGIEPNDS